MRFPKKPGIFHGYWIVLVAFLCLFITSGSAYYAFSLFAKPLEADLGWSRGEIMRAFTIRALIMGGISPFIGRIVDRYGAKRVIVAGALIFGLGFLFLTQITSLWHFYAGYAIVGMGMSAAERIPSTSVVSNWFQKKRGFAIGIMSTGVGIGGFALAPLVGSYLIPNFGWRAAYLALAIISWVLIIPLALLLVRNRPADMGLYPDGAKAPEEAAVTQVSSSAPGGPTLKIAIAASPFWLIALSFLINSFSHGGVVQNQVPHLQDIGFPVALAAKALGGIGLASAAGKFFFGWLCDRIRPKYACAISLALQATGIIMLMNIDSTTSTAIIWLYAVTFGLGIGGWLPTMSILTSTTFGLSSYGAIFGGLTLVQSIGGATGPLTAGYMYDSMNTYFWAFVLFAALYTIAIPAVLLVRRPVAAAKDRV